MANWRTRDTWDQTWMHVAHSIARRSKCDGRQVGSVIVDPSNRPIAVGYNGAPADMPLTGYCSGWCPRMSENNKLGTYDDCYTVHAEANALLFADRREFQGGTIYITTVCCWDCAKLIANSGIKRVVIPRWDKQDLHRDPVKSIRFLTTCGIEVTEFGHSG